MKTILNRKDFLKMLTNAKMQVEKRNTMPILSSVHLELFNGFLSCQSSNLDVTVDETLKVEQAGAHIKLTCDFKKLYDVVKFRDLHNITLEQRDLILLVDDTELKCEPSELWPILPSLPESFEKINLYDGLKLVKYAVSNDETRYHLNGAFVECKDSKLTCVATDGHRLAKVTCDSTLKSDLNFILSTKGVDAVLKLFGKFDIELGQSDRFIFFKNELITLTVLKIDGRYPNYRQFIPNKFNHKVKVDRKKLLKTVKDLIPLTCKKSSIASLEFKNNKLTLENTTTGFKFEGTGKNRKEITIDDVRPKVIANIDCKFEGDLKIGVNLKYLYDSLLTLNSDIVDIKLNDKLSPFNVCSNKFDCDQIIMPMRF